MVDTTSIWNSIHHGIEWIRDMTAQHIPINNDLALLILAVLTVFILKGRRIISGMVLIGLIIAIFLLLKMG